MASDSENEQKDDQSTEQMSAAQRERAQRSRQRALRLRADRLREARQRDDSAAAGGFVRSASPSPPRLPAAGPAPLPHASLQPPCEECGELIAHSFLLDQFALAVCDACRAAGGEQYALVPRSAAKQEYLLQDCDLDLRPPPLRSVTRRNPHRVGGDMRLYVRAAVEARALEVWGGAMGLEAERARRKERAGRAAAGAARRRLRALRAAARADLVTAPAAPRQHDHCWAPEEERADGDYERRCRDCGLVQTYEKM